MIRIKSAIHKRYLKINFLFFSFFRKNNTEIVNNIKNPSTLTIVAKPANKNAKYENSLFVLNIIKILILPKKIYIGSVIPKIEFIINLGSKAKIAAPTIDNSLLKNFLQMRNTIGIVKHENKILKLLCNVI